MLLWQRAQRRTIVHVLYANSRNARDRNYEYLRAFRSTDLAAQGRRVAVSDMAVGKLSRPALKNWILAKKSKN